jgi:hypothetical protein
MTSVPPIASSARAGFASRTSCAASFRFARTSFRVAPCVLAPGSSSMKPMYPSGTFRNTAVSWSCTGPPLPFAAIYSETPLGAYRIAAQRRAPAPAGRTTPAPPQVNTHPAIRHLNSPTLQRLVRLLDAPVGQWYYSSMKTAISLPDKLFESTDALARRLGLSRSQLVATALAEFLAKHRGRDVTRRLDAVYSHETSTLDAGTARLQSRSLRGDPW